MSAAGPPLPRSIRLIRLPGLVCSLMSGVKRGYWHSSLLEAILAQQGEGRLGATGFLDLSSGSVEAVFTLPQYTGKGVGSQIIEAIKSEARERGFEQLTLSSTPNAQPFYEKHGFKLLRESMYSSALAQAELRCREMSIKLQR